MLDHGVPRVLLSWRTAASLRGMASATIRQPCRTLSRTSIDLRRRPLHHRARWPGATPRGPVRVHGGCGAAGRVAAHAYPGADAHIPGRAAVTVEVLLAHPGRARVTRRRSAEPLSRDYDVWSSDGTTVTTYDARSERASVRPVPRSVVGATRPDLPRFSQVYLPADPSAGRDACGHLHPPAWLHPQCAADRAGRSDGDGARSGS